MSETRRRKLTIVARRGPGGPFVVAVSLATATAAACGTDVVVSEPVTGGSPGSTTMMATGGNSQGGDS